MARLDRFLQVMIEKKALGLQLESGAPPALVLERGVKPVSSSQPTTAQLLALLDEILQDGHLEVLSESGRLMERIERDGLPAIELDAQLVGGSLRATLTPLETGAGPSGDAPPPETAMPEPAGPPAGEHRNEIDALFHLMVERGASDLHLSSGVRPSLRVDGRIEAVSEWPELDADGVARLIEPIAPERNRVEFRETNDTDFAYEVAGLARFRCNFFVDRKGPGAVFRVIPSEILTVEDLGLSPHILDLCRLTKGLVLVTGPTGSGKSTTLCALVDYINRIRHDHIITIEDPIEFVHENNGCLVNQREVVSHTQSFKRALRAALREDPDIVLIGELRDLETIAIAIETAETGHLVFGTLHTTTAISTVDRIIDQFPPAQQSQIRVMLAESLKGVISQTLCRKIGGGRVAALEVLMGIPAVVKLVREGKTFQIPSIMQTGRKYGMVTLNEALTELVRRNLIEADEAYLRAVDKLGIVKQLQGAGKDLSFLETQAEPALT